MSRLSESNIELAENFILNNSPKSMTASLSICDVENGKICFENIKNMPPTSYTLFGSNACGYSSYGFYKAKNDQIYIIEAFCNNITAYYEPKIYGFDQENNNIVTNNK